MPSRLEHEDINLGIAIDIEKKDGSRNLLVPNIKGANRMHFGEMLGERGIARHYGDAELAQDISYARSE